MGDLDGPRNGLRRTELKRRTPLTAKTALTTRTPLHRTGPLSPTSRKRRQQAPERTRVVNALREAQQGRCPRCGRDGLVLHGHERIGMAHGADYTRPDVAVCDPCNGAIEDAPAVSAWNGWKVSSKHPHDPALRPWQARALDGSIVNFTTGENT